MGSIDRTTEHTVPVIDCSIGELSDERTNCLRQLLKQNHDNYSILYNDCRFHNHSPHFLCSAYLYGSSSDQIQDIYDEIVARNNLEAWKQSPGCITNDNYHANIGKGDYQRAWVEFFEEKLRDDLSGRSWQTVAIELLFDIEANSEAKPVPMLHCLNSALGHPLIHLGYAFEVNSLELAAEALSLVVTCYDEQLAGLLTIMPNNTARPPASDLAEVFKLIRSDKSLPNFPQPGDENIAVLLDQQKCLDTVISHINSWDLAIPTLQLLQAYRFASLLLISTSPRVRDDGYDFFLVHLLTMIHAVRVLLPHLPTQHHGTIIKQWLTIAALAYIAQNRPQVAPLYVKEIDLQGRDWEYVRREATGGRFSRDAHFVKACRALHVGAETWKGYDEEEWFLRCAVRFVSEFDGWGGFDIEAEAAELVREQRKMDGIFVR